MKKGYLLKVAALLVLCCVMFGCGKEDPLNPTSQKNSIYGTVTDYATGELVSNANVRLNPIGETTLTGSDGMFQFTGVLDGTYSLSLSKNGYVDLDDDYVIEIKNGKSVRRDVQLKSQFQSFRITVNGMEVDTLDFGIDFSYNEIYFSIENNGTVDITINIGDSSDWLTVQSYSETLSPNTSSIRRVKVYRDELSIGDNIGYVYVSSGTLTKTLVIIAKGAGEPVVKNPTIISVSSDGRRAVVSSSVTDDGGSYILEKGFESYVSGYSIPDYTECGEGNNNFQTEIYGTYGLLKRVRAYAKNGYRTGYSDWVYF